MISVKHILYAAIPVCLAAAVIACVSFVRSRKVQPDTDDIDGGVVKRYWADAPKVIESNDIVTFHCEISLIAVCDVDDLGYRVYTLDAALGEGEVCVKCDWYDRSGKSGKAEYTAAADFMERLQKIVAEYDFAKYNGYYHSVSGLPDMYGESLDILYASGESINAYDNQSGFMRVEAARALITLFRAACS